MLHQLIMKPYLLVTLAPIILLPSSSCFRLTIPLIGPIPQAPPLIIGGELSLSPPTPLQWKSLSESAIIHMQHLKDEKDSPASIEGAPIVAIIDEYSANSLENTVGRYATLAAVVGVSKGTDEEMSLEDMVANPHSNRVRLVGVGRAIVKDLFYKVPSKLKPDVTDVADDNSDIDKNEPIDGMQKDLLEEIGKGISSLSEHELEEMARKSLEEGGELQIEGQKMEPLKRKGGSGGGSSKDITSADNDDEDDDEEEEYNQDEIDSFPIIMANFEPLHDNHGVNGGTSPIHELNELHKLVQKIERLHTDRKKLVAGLKAGQTRLENARKMMEVLAKAEIDYDGLGLLGGDDGGILIEDEMGLGGIFFGDGVESFNAETKKEEMSVNELLAKYGKSTEENDPECPVEPELTMTQSSHTSDENISTATAEEQCSTITPPPTNEITNYLCQFENFGINHYSAFSTLSSLTQRTIHQLHPYYSPEHRRGEMFQYEIASFVAWRCLVGYCSNADVAWALTRRSSKERLEWAHYAMACHYELLVGMAKEVGRELRDCGEECTDLW